jgi:hypothetical protein
LKHISRTASLFARLAVVGAIAVVAVSIGSPALAAKRTIGINTGNISTTAAAFKTHLCSANQGGGPFAGSDVWVFVLPGEHATSGDFVSLTADFGVNGTKTITFAANPSNFDNGGPQTAKAWIVTTAGWTLVGATAEITGTGGSFNLTHTCPSSGTPAPSPTPSRTPDPTPTPTPSSRVTPSTGGSPGTTPSGGVSTGGGGSLGSGSLGLGVVALVVATGGAVILVLAWRRRNNA